MNRLILSLVSLAAIYSVGVYIHQADWTPTALINLGYYLLLLFNTYFSLAFTERAFHVRNRRDGALNVLLTGIYLILPWLVGDASRFHLYMAAFFAIAVVKYTTWWAVPAAAFFLSRKIPINAGGGLLSLIVLGVLEAVGDGYAAHASMSAFVIFVLTNIWMLRVDPLYRAS